MPTISSLFVQLSLQADNFNSGLRDAQREAAAFEKNIKPTVTAVKELGEAMSIVGDVVAGAMVEMTLKTAEYGAELEHLHVKSGAAVEDIAKLGFAASQNGSSMDDLGNSLKFLSKNMELASVGSGAQAMAFAKLGISTQEVNAAHGDASVVFKLVADRLNEMGGPSAHMADLMGVMGKGAANMATTLALGSDGLKEMGDRAEAAGKVMSAEATEASLQFTRSLDDLKQSAEGVGISVGMQLMPALKSVIDTVKSGVQDVNGFVKEHEGWTQAVFAVTAAIGGTGGLLLALTGILLVLPQLKEAFALLMAQMELVPWLAVAAALGALAKAGYDTKKAIDDSKQSELEAAQATQKLADQVAAAGGPVIKLGTNFAEWNLAVIEAAKGIKDLNPQLTATEKAHNDAAAAAKKHTQELIDQVEAANHATANLKEFNALLVEQQSLMNKDTEFWAKEFQDFKNRTFAGGEAVKQALKGIEDTTRQIISTHNEIAAIEQAAGDYFIKNQDFWNKQLQIFRDGTEGQKQAVKDNQKALDDTTRGIVKNYDDIQKLQTEFEKSIGRSFAGISTGIASDIAGSIGHLKDLGDAIKKTMEDAATQGLKSLLDGLFKPLTDELTKLGKSFADWATGAVSSVGKVTSSAAGGVAGGAGGIGASGGGIGSGASGLLSSLGSIGSIVGAVGSVAGAFQGAREEGTLNAIEYNTRATYIEIRDMMNLILQPLLLAVTALMPNNAGGSTYQANQPINPAYAAIIAQSLYNLTRNGGVQIVGSR